MINNYLKVASFQRVRSGSADQEGTLKITQRTFPFDDRDPISAAGARARVMREHDTQRALGLAPQISAWRSSSAAMPQIGVSR